MALQVQYDMRRVGWEGLWAGKLLIWRGQGVGEACVNAYQGWIWRLCGVAKSRTASGRIHACFLRFAESLRMSRRLRCYDTESGA
jgi:hypothetical protein